jgi:hypothetical protein
MRSLKHWRTVVAAVTSVVCAAPLSAQILGGEIFGRVTDLSGAVLPGVTVTLEGPALIRPEVATTTETGAYSFPRVPVGTYTIRFELAGFKQFVREAVQIATGFSAEINPRLDLSTVQETVTVTGGSPVVDTNRRPPVQPSRRTSFKAFRPHAIRGSCSNRPQGSS